jgi:uncharacterized protein
VDTGRPVVRARPRRTCVGCRALAAKAELLRLVVVDGSVTPDPAGRSPGRGAHLHPDLGCLDLALRRKAFPRAFRLPGPLDSDLVRGYLEAAAQPADGAHGARGTSAAPADEGRSTT